MNAKITIVCSIVIVLYIIIVLYCRYLYCKKNGFPSKKNTHSVFNQQPIQEIPFNIPPQEILTHTDIKAGNKSLIKEKIEALEKGDGDAENIKQELFALLNDSGYDLEEFGYTEAQINELIRRQKIKAG